MFPFGIYNAILPSEEEIKLLLQQQMKDVLTFHYLPILWYYPIPNEIREFWQ
jgi:hypothetical protein